jgi:hypothetical protein
MASLTDPSPCSAFICESALPPSREMCGCKRWTALSEKRQQPDWPGSRGGCMYVSTSPHEPCFPHGVLTLPPTSCYCLRLTTCILLCARRWCCGQVNRTPFAGLRGALRTWVPCTRRRLNLAPSPTAGDPLARTGGSLKSRQARAATGHDATTLQYEWSWVTVCETASLGDVTAVCTLL